MKVFQYAALAGMALAGNRFVPRCRTKEKGIAELVRFLRCAKQRVIISGSSLEHTVYENPDVIDQIRRLLENGGRFQALIGPVDKDTFYREHPELAQLHTTYPGQVEIYTAAEIPPAHFGVVDNKHLFYEENHLPGTDREVYYEYRNSELANQLNQMFENLIRAFYQN